MNATINGSSMDYQTEGPRTGLPVVFIHGFPFSRAMWAPQIEAVKGRAYAVAYDVRGHGGSAVGDGQYSVEYFVDDLIALLDHLRISRAVLVGLSMGGYIALRTVERQQLEGFGGSALVRAEGARHAHHGDEYRVAAALLSADGGDEVPRAHSGGD